MDGKGKKGKNKGNGKSVGSTTSPKAKPVEKKVPSEVTLVTLDSLSVKVLSLRLTDEDPYKEFNIKVSFMDQLICYTTITSISAKDPDNDNESYIAEGTMNIDPSDGDKMCMLSDYPMTVQISPAKKTKHSTSANSGIAEDDEPLNIKKSDLVQTMSQTSKWKSDLFKISCCNIDILPLFIEKDSMLVRKRLEPMVKRSTLFTKSWCNLPLLTMEVSIVLDHSNEAYHQLYHHANHMTVTLLGAYNMDVPFHDDFNYVAASKIALGNDKNHTTIMFEQGYERPKEFTITKFFPHWESLRTNDDIFTVHDIKYQCENGLDDIQNDSNIDLNHYVNRLASYYSVIWGSFHRNLMPKSCEEWFKQHIRKWHWPLEIHINHEERGYAYMAFLDLFKLLYPGEQSVRMAVPLQWWSYGAMMDACACEPLLPSHDKYTDKASSVNKSSAKKTEDTEHTEHTIPDETIIQTGADGNTAFVIIEVKLARPLVKIQIPPIIPNTEIDDMLMEIENDVTMTRRCTGRGQTDYNWQRTVLAAVAALRKVPYHGATDISQFIRQLAENRVREEVFTTFWREAAVYVNNNFVVDKYLDNEKEYQNMLSIAFGCMMRVSQATVLSSSPEPSLPALDPVLRAARHARQMHDREHAKNLNSYLVHQNPDNADYWREFGNSMKHYKNNWARICIDKSIFLNPRHPLTLISKGCMADADEADVFFDAVLAMYPFWQTGWVIISTYYWQRQMYKMSEAIITKIRLTGKDNLLQDIRIARAWEHELGDWWDNTPLLPGMSPFYDAADLLLRIKSLKLAKACLARAVLDGGETVQYYHILALCYRLNGNTKQALCHLTEAIGKFGDISYLRTLQGECYYLLKEIPQAMEAFEKAGTCTEAYSMLMSIPCRDVQRSRSHLVDLVRRQPCAYTWMALADNWRLLRSKKDSETAEPDIEFEKNVTGKTCAAACAIQALKYDKLYARAWALLSDIVPVPTRRTYYNEMAMKCGYVWKRSEAAAHHDQLNRPEHVCHRLATAMLECHCKICDDLRSNVSQ